MVQNVSLVFQTSTYCLVFQCSYYSLYPNISKTKTKCERNFLNMILKTRTSKDQCRSCIPQSTSLFHSNIVVDNFDSVLFLITVRVKPFRQVDCTCIRGSIVDRDVIKPIPTNSVTFNSPNDDNIYTLPVKIQCSFDLYKLIWQSNHSTRNFDTQSPTESQSEHADLIRK